MDLRYEKNPLIFNKRVVDLRLSCLPNRGKEVVYEGIKVKVGDSVRFSEENDGASFGFVTNIVDLVLHLFIWIRTGDLMLEGGGGKEFLQSSHVYETQVFNVDEVVQVYHKLENPGENFFFSHFYKFETHRIYPIKPMVSCDRYPLFIYKLLYCTKSNIILLIELISFHKFILGQLRMWFILFTQSKI